MIHQCAPIMLHLQFHKQIVALSFISGLHLEQLTDHRLDEHDQLHVLASPIIKPMLKKLPFVFHNGDVPYAMEPFISIRFTYGNTWPVLSYTSLETSRSIARCGSTARCAAPLYCSVERLWKIWLFFGIHRIQPSIRWFSPEQVGSMQHESHVIC